MMMIFETSTRSEKKGSGGILKLTKLNIDQP